LLAIEQYVKALQDEMAAKVRLGKVRSRA